MARQVQQWAAEWKQLAGKTGNPIADEACSFRGASPLQCGLYDPTEPDPGDRFLGSHPRNSQRQALIVATVARLQAQQPR